MSGPVRTEDVPTTEIAPDAPAPIVEITPSHAARVGAHTVLRALPMRLRRTVGPWCFVDHLPPAGPPNAGMGIGPHPHIGLQTVTWLVAGEVLHTDSLGSEQLIRPGELNLMTAGHGIVHAEETPATYGGASHAVQLWVAQPERTRHGAPAFEHHAELPRVDLGGVIGRVLVGDFAGATSPARRDTDHTGVELVLHHGRHALPLRREHESAIVVLDGVVSIAGAPAGSDTTVVPGHLAYLGAGREELVLDAPVTTRLLLLAGIPFEARPLMWWNFVARTRDEMDAAHDAWQSGDGGRFGPVRSALERIPAPPPPWQNASAR
ncbi:MAG TPA: pirin family protein [Candidatus Dormibacteraeota bacterium]|jgi:redox-sensitive bicupin YhaK (pirin superfamily)|nr:pirin family protein [Candidatus Dormibacteraeota bacterium]